MRCLLKSLLFIGLTGIYSCHSPTKKLRNDTAIVTHQPSKRIEITSSSGEIDRDTLRQPLITKVIFPDFSVKVNNTAFYVYRHSNNKIISTDDSINNKVDISNYRMWTLTTQNDSVKLFTDDDRGLDIGSIEIIPNNKTDRFEVSYSFKLEIFAENGKDGTLWEDMMPYKKIKDSLAYFFRTPEHNNLYAEIGSKIKALKKKFNLRDTAFKKEAANPDYGIYTEHGVIYNNQLCEIPYTPIIYLKVDRFSQKRIVDTKYLIVDFSIPE